jgi:protein-disulfide isomerase
VTDNGKEKHNNNVLITRDNRLLVIGSLVKVDKDPQSEVVPRLRQQFKIPDTVNLTATPFHASTFPELEVTSVTVEDPRGKQSQDFYLTKDRQCLVLGSVYNLAVDPQKHALQTLNTMNSPSTGSRAAPVTIVEFADLQCASCSRMHDFLENDILRKYGEKVRVVYKDFPLPSIHDWTLTATIANQCVYQINPSAYVPFRSMVFKNQASINAANVRDLVLSYGEQLGVDRLRLAACVDAKSTLPRIEESVKEGQAVGVQATPTSFINGKMVVGLPTSDAYFKDIDEALRAAK